MTWMRQPSLSAASRMQMAQAHMVAAIQLCPQACPGPPLGPKPGSASYSATKAMVRPVPGPY